MLSHVLLAVLEVTRMKHSAGATTNDTSNRAPRAQEEGSAWHENLALLLSLAVAGPLAPRILMAFDPVR